LLGSTLGGQFFTAAKVKATISGNTLLYKDGTRTCREELEDLLKAGDSSGVRLLARVNEEREIIIEPLPAEGDTPYTLGVDGKIRTLAGREVGAGERIEGKRALLAPGWLDEGVVIWGVEWGKDGVKVKIEPSQQN
jgi:hypothetical protein